MLLSLMHTSAANLPGCKVDLPAGAVVLLEVTEQLASEKVTVGQLVKCQVIADVVVDGKVVIRTGAVATARVKRIAPTTYNQAETLTLTAHSARAVDGQMIALHSGDQSIKGDFPNQPARVRIGTPLQANVVNNYQICGN